jgi:SAM-dependent methyltransferase
MNYNSSKNTSHLLSSPLTGTSIGVEVVRDVSVIQLIEGYRLRLGVDISSLFSGITKLQLMHDTHTGMSFFSPLVTGDAAFYATMSRRPGYHRPNKAEFRIAAPYIPAGVRVLEVGAGVGHFTMHLKDVDYTGLEFNADAVAEAVSHRRNVCSRDVRDLVLEQFESFDVTCAFQVLEHVADPLGMIGAMVSLTRPGGRIILATPNAGAYISRCRDLLSSPPHHVTWWEDRTWGWVASQFGLIDLKIQHTPIDEMLGVWAQMIASDGVARQLGLTLDPVVDESPLRNRIDQLAAPIARTILAGITHKADVPEAGHTSVAVFTKPEAATDRARSGAAREGHGMAVRERKRFDTVGEMIVDFFVHDTPDALENRRVSSGGTVTCAFLGHTFPGGLPSGFGMAEIGVWHGETTIKLAELLPEDGFLHIFDFEQIVQAVSRSLSVAGHTNVSGFGCSTKACDSYNWSLMRLLISNPLPIYDYIYVDGSHAWEIDGLAFFLLDRLLKPGGYMDFDDYGWSMAASPALNPTACPEILNWFTDEQIKTSHIMLIVELLVKRDTRYHEVVSNKIFRKARA